MKRNNGSGPTTWGLCCALLFILDSSSGNAQTWRVPYDSAWQLSGQNRNELAVEYATRALKIASDSLGEQDTVVADILSDIALFNWVMGKLDAALDAVEQALPIREKSNGPENAKIADLLHRKGTCLWDVGRFAEGEVFLRRAALMRERVHGPEADPTLRTLTNLACLLHEEGKLAEADQLYTHLMEIWKRQGARTGGVPANNLGNFYAALGRTSLAESLFVHALAKSENGRGDPFTLLSLALLYQSTDRPSQAEMTFKSAIAALDSVEGKDNPDNPLRGYFRTYLGEFYRTRGMYAEAESSLTWSMELIERAGRQKHLYGLRCARMLAGLYLDTRQFAKAETRLKYLIEETIAMSGEAHPDMVENYLMQARYYSLREQKTEAMQSALLSAQVAVKVFHRGSAFMTEAEALKFFKTLRSSLDALVDNAIAMNDSLSPIRKNVLDLILSAKGIASEAFARRARQKDTMSAGSSSHEETQLLRLKADLAQAYVRAGRGDVTHARELTDSLSRAVDSLESLIAHRNEGVNSQDITLDDLVPLIPHNSAIVEFLRYECLRSVSKAPTSRYAVLVIDEFGESRLLDLADAGTAEDLILRIRQHLNRVASMKRPISRQDFVEYRAISKKLYSLIWKPINSVLESRQTVFICPDGALNLLAFAGLMDANDRFLIEKQRIHQLSAARDILRIVRDSTGSGSGLLAMGDPDYDATSIQLASSGSDALYASEAGTWITRNVRSGCTAMADMKVRRLPGTRDEITAIAERFPSAEVFTGISATEENFKRYAPGRQRIHLATHSYSISGECTPRGELSGWYSIENPLLQSGLLLAGANVRGADPKASQREDGVLTSLEVSAMNLLGTDLVVLSACETGLGRVEQGEGVYGLRRAFQVAGAKTVISSLWQVSDDETMRFMKSLYSTKAGTYPMLMQQVALRQIREARLRGRPAHPYTWGAFVATGEWRIAR